MDNEFYNHHYITTRGDGAITAAWSDGPSPENDITNAICINDKGGYQFRFILDGKQTEENPPIYDMNGIPLYKWDGSQVVKRTEEEIESDRAAIPVPPPSPQEQLQADVAQLKVSVGSAIAAATAFAAVSTEIPDATALKMAVLFPSWEEALAAGQALPQGRIIENDGQLYRVAQTVTPQAHQPPGGEGMLAIYRSIELEHAGTLEDPIPWVYGMDCLAGMYYIYNGEIYRVATGGNMIPCVWAPDTPGLWQWEKVSG